jgi:hypothetical protein
MASQTMTMLHTTMLHDASRRFKDHPFFFLPAGEFPAAM